MTKIIIFLMTLSINAYSKEIKVINWNTYLLPKIAKSTSQDERAKLMAEYLLTSEEDFDIITLQEVFTGNGYETFTKLLKEKYPYHTGSPVRKWYKPVNSGLLILSKYPIREQSFYMFSGMAHADQFSSKGALAITVELEKDLFVHVATTHLQAQQGQKYELIRESEYKYIKDEVINNFKLDELPLILTGDFNIDSYHPKEFEPFIEHMQFELPNLTGEELFTVNSLTNNLVEIEPEQSAVKEVLDYIFLIPGIYSEQIQRSYIIHPKGDYNYKDLSLKNASLSDHLPVISVINI